MGNYNNIRKYQTSKMAMNTQLDYIYYITPDGNILGKLGNHDEYIVTKICKSYYCDEIIFL